jgi:hypothetical protein
MSPEQIIALVGQVAWPITALILAAFVRTPIVKLFDRLAIMVGRGRSLSVKVGSTSLAVESHRSEELVSGMLELIQGMTADESRLFRTILNQPPKGLELTRAFERRSTYHDTLRSLRDRNLIQPAERGTWKIGKHAAVTRIGHAILGIDELRDQLLEDGMPSWWKDDYQGERFRNTAG